MRVAVVGSGPAGLFCAKALVERGVQVTLLDVGKELDADRRKKAEMLAETPRNQWPPEIVRNLSDNPTVTPGKVPKKLLFGSDFAYQATHPFAPIDNPDVHPTPTFSKGGFSMIWGSAALPVSDQDLADWPINHDDLAPYYRKVLQTMPLCGGDGTLEDAFPSLSPSLDELYQGAQGRNLLRDLERSKEWLRTRGVLYGPARLAIHTTESTSSMGCNSCGFCLSGCPRNAIFNTLGVLDEICGEGKVEYRNNSIVHRVDEQDTGVTVTIIDEPTGRQSVETFDAVFLGAGAINTTRILLTSRELYERTITLKESKKFLLPLLRFKSDTEAMTERQVTLANIFMEINIPALSKHWIHMQMSPMNDLIMKSFGLAPDAPSSLRRTILSPILQRFMVAWCGLHSDHGDKFEIKLARSGAYEPPILYVRSKPNLDGRRVAWRIARKLIGIGLRTRTIFVPYPLFTEPSRGTHCGGAFPMRDKPTDLLDSDILGRPFGWKRVYAVDSSVFPSIPGTTIAFNIMANAYRIGTNAPL